MNKQILVIVGIVVVIVVAGLIFFSSPNSTPNSSGAMEQSGESMNAGEGMMDQDPTGAMMEGEEALDDSTMEDDTQSMMEKGAYISYSETAASEAAQDGKAVLFFHASWCPTCKAANEAFTSRADEIPPGVTVLKTDYDTESELKAKYGITYQHTFVQIDENGNEITKWNGGDIDELATNIQ